MSVDVRWRSRPFGEGASARHVIAEALSRRDRHDHIPPGIWAQSGAVLNALRAAGFTIRKPSTVPDHLPDNDESRGHGSVS